jgi:class 3 adenylate cyclase
MTSLPTGTVTFLFTDIEGSTRLQRELGDGYGNLVSQHRRLLRDAVAENGGVEIDSQGDAFFFSFARARAAAAAAVRGQLRIAAEQWPEGSRPRVRMGLHTGEPALGDEGYVGLDVVRGARVAAAAHGGQILLSESTRALLADVGEGLRVSDLGEHTLKDMDRPERLYQLEAPGLDTSFPAARTQRAPSIGDAFTEKIDAYVRRQLDQALREVEVEQADPAPEWRKLLGGGDSSLRQVDDERDHGRDG